MGQTCTPCADIEVVVDDDGISAPYFLTNCAICSFSSCEQCDAGFHLDIYTNQYNDNPVGLCVEHTEEIDGCSPPSVPAGVGYYALDASYIDTTQGE